MQLELGEEINAQGEQRQRARDPQIAAFFQTRQKRGQRRIERRQEEKAVIADAEFQPLQKAYGRFRALAAEAPLHAVIERLFCRERSLRRNMGLPGERGWHAVLILAEHLGHAGPASRHGFVLE